MGNPFGTIKPTKHTFDWQDIAVALVRAKGLHEGKWSLTFSLANQVRHVTMNGGLCPSAVSVFSGIGLDRMPDDAPLNSLTVDAAEVNPSMRVVLAHTVN